MINRTIVACVGLVAGGLGLFLSHFDHATTWLRGPDAAKLAPLTLAPDFTWAPSRQLLTSSGPHGQVLVFVATTCPCSNVYAQRFVSLAKDYGRQFHFLWINEDKVRLLDTHPTEPLQQALVALQQSGLPVDSMRDVHDRVATQFGVKVTPEVFVLDARGYIRYHGRVDDNQTVSKVQTHDLHDALDALSHGRDITVKETRATGCFIDDT